MIWVLFVVFTAGLLIFAEADMRGEMHNDLALPLGVFCWFGAWLTGLTLLFHGGF